MYGCEEKLNSVAKDAWLSEQMLLGEQIPVYTGPCKDSQSDVFMTTANTLDIPVSCAALAKIQLGEQYSLCGVVSVRSACPLSCGLCEKTLSSWYDPSCDAEGKKCFAAGIAIPYMLWGAVAFLLWS